MSNHTSSTAAIRPSSWEDGQTLTTDTWAEDATIEENPYGLAKYSAERLVRDWHSSREFNQNGDYQPCVVLAPSIEEAPEW